MSSDIEEKRVIVIFCPPYTKYKVQPEDMSKCELVDCPICKQRMWLSEKKKTIKEFHESTGDEIIFECYTCFKERIEDDPSIMKNHTRIDL